MSEFHSEVSGGNIGSSSDNCERNKDLVIVISGATGSGKSKVSMDLCQKFNGEIVVADCVQVYKHVTIGSNKPSFHDTTTVKHHLIDRYDTNMNISSGDFVRDAADSIRDILNRGKTPIVVGGSSMWINWLVRGIPDAPKSTPETKKKVDEIIGEYEEGKNWLGALEELSKLDPAKAEKLSRNDWMRLRRAYEIVIARQEMAQQGIVETNNLEEGSYKASLLKGLDIRPFFVMEEREPLYRHIDLRCLQMLKMGLFQEICNLIVRGEIHPSTTLAKAIGYRQTIAYLCRKNFRVHDGEAFLAFLSDFASQTRQYARRQMQWARKEKEFLWIENRREVQTFTIQDNFRINNNNNNNGNSGNKRAKNERKEASRKSLFPVFSELLQVHDDEGPYLEVSREIEHWCRMPREDFQSMVQRQVDVANCIADIRKMPYIPVGFQIDSELTRTAIVTMLGTKEINPYKELFRILGIKDRTSAGSIAVSLPSLDALKNRGLPESSWLYNAFDPKNGITPEDIEQRRFRFSAESMSIRPIESRYMASQMKNYNAQFETINLGDRVMHYDSLLEEADECVQILRKSAFDKVEAFQAWIQSEDGEEES